MKNKKKVVQEPVKVHPQEVNLIGLSDEDFNRLFEGVGMTENPKAYHDAFKLQVMRQKKAAT